VASIGSRNNSVGLRYRERAQWLWRLRGRSGRTSCHPPARRRTPAALPPLEHCPRICHQRRRLSNHHHARDPRRL